MRKFDYSFLENGMLPADLINITSGIYTLKTSAGSRKSEFITVFTQLESIAKIQSVKIFNGRQTFYGKCTRKI